MLKSQEVTLKLSETRRELNAITAKDDPSDKEVERSAELRGELDKLEERLQAAIRLEDKPEESEQTAENRERLELRGKSRIGRYVESAMRGRTLDGPEAELQAAAGVDGIPFELWERPAEKRDERRDVTPAPAAGVGVNLQPIQPAIFAPSVAPMLGIDMPTGEAKTRRFGKESSSGVQGGSAGYDSEHSLSMVEKSILSAYRIVEF